MGGAHQEVQAPYQDGDSAQTKRYPAQRMRAMRPRDKHHGMGGRQE
jgi:hypothetical protein